MKAVVYTEYGPPEVLRLAEVEKPVPQEGEVLIKTHATTVSTGDVNGRGFTFVPPGFGPLPRLSFGIRSPKKPILGSVAAGVVEALGDNVSRFQVGDQVYGINGNVMGAYAEYVCWPEDWALALKPADLTFEEAAAIPFGATTALYFLRDKAAVQSGQKVLITGASGSVGTAAVQLASHFGADVTGVCSTSNLALVESLGADHVIDYTQEDFTQSGETFDIIFDLVVGKTSFSRCEGSLNPNGFYLAVAGGLKEAVQMLWTSRFGSKKVIFGGGAACERTEYLLFLEDLVRAGEFRAVIDRTYPLEEMVEAHRYADKGHKKGNIVITVAAQDTTA